MKETINKNYIELYFDPQKMGVKRDVKHEKFQEGDVFSLQGVECDGFKMPQKEYQIIKKINHIDGVDLDGVVVKQIGGEQSTIFSLTKLDCQNLGIEFQPSLQIFPSNMNWKKISNSSSFGFKPFSKNDPLQRKSLYFNQVGLFCFTFFILQVILDYSWTLDNLGALCGIC